MPQTAAIVDWLRGEFGKEAAERTVLRGKTRGGFYAAEIGPDGVFREFGKSRSGSRAVVGLETGEVRMEGAA